MTRQYLAGELSIILGELETAAADESARRDVGRLRRRAETSPPSRLGPTVSRALELVDRMCLDSLTRGESVGFDREVAISAELWEFGVCAGFLDEGQTRKQGGNG